MSVNKGERSRSRSSRPTPNYHDRHPAPRLLRRQRRAADRRPNLHADRHRRRSRPARRQATTGPDRLRQLERVGSWTVPSNAVSGVYIAHSSRDDTGGDEPHPVRRARRREPLGHRRPDLGRDLAGLQHLRRQQPLHVHGACPPGNPRATRPPTRSPTTGRSTTEQDSAGLGAVPRRRVPDDPLPRGERLRRQLHERRRHPRRGPLLAEPQDVHLQRPRRVLVRRRSAPTSRRRATPASTSRSSAATRCSGRRGSSRASPARPRANRTIVSYKDTHFDAPTGSRWSGREPGATRASPAADGDRPRTRSPASRSSSTPARATSRCPPHTASCACGATRRRATLAPGQTLTLAPGHARLRVGRRRRQRVPAGGPVPALVDDGQRPRGVHRLRQHDRSATARRRTT